MFARVAVALVAALSILAPAPSGAQESDGPGGDNDQAARHGNAEIEIDIDVLRVDNVQVESVLNDLAANVAAQQEQLHAAQSALRDARAALGAANAQVLETQAAIDQLTSITDEVVIDAFVNPPTDASLEALASDSLSDAAIKQSILNTQATSDAEKLEMLQTSRERLDVEIAAKEDAARLAEARASDAEAALADLQSALSQQANFVAEVERRIDQRLAEAANLADIDPELAAQIQAREFELAAVLGSLQDEAQARAAREQAAQLAQVAEAQRGSSIQEPPGGLATVSCPAGGSITVAGDIADQVQRLLNDAADDGVTMCGNGYRDPAEQIALRRAHCGTSYYAIYEAPSSACSPPTARPGTSLHEQGLAVDFTCNGGGTVSSGDECDGWLENNAGNYGLYNLPSEAWHYSITGE